MNYAAERDIKVGELTKNLKKIREEEGDKRKKLENSMKDMEHALRIYKKAIQVNHGNVT